MYYTHINCPKPGCGFSAEGRTVREAQARMVRHTSSDSHRNWTYKAGK